MSDFRRRCHREEGLPGNCNVEHHLLVQMRGSVRSRELGVCTVSWATSPGLDLRTPSFHVASSEWLCGSLACECQGGLPGRWAPLWHGPALFPTPSSLAGLAHSGVPFSLLGLFSSLWGLFTRNVFLKALFPSQTVGARCPCCVSSPTKRPAWRRAGSPGPGGAMSPLFCADCLSPPATKRGAPALASRGAWRFWDPWVVRCSSKGQ